MSLFFSNRDFQCYKFPSKCCFTYITQIFISSAFTFIQFNTVIFVFFFFSLLTWLFRSIYLVSKYLSISKYHFVIEFYLNSIVVRKQACMSRILLNILRLVLWFRILSLLVNIPCTLENNNYLLLLDTVFYNCQLGWYCCSSLLYLYWFSIYLIYQLLRVKVEKTDYNCRFVHFSLQFYHFLFYVFWSSLISCIHIYNHYGSL